MATVCICGPREDSTTRGAMALSSPSRWPGDVSVHPRSPPSRGSSGAPRVRNALGRGLLDERKLWHPWFMVNVRPTSVRDARLAALKAPRPTGEGRELLLQAAVIAFAASGYEGASMRQIAAAAGLSPGSIYHHFKSKQDLLVGIMDRVQAELTIAAQSAIALVPHENPRIQLQVSVRAYVRFYIDHQFECGVLDRELRYLDPENRVRNIEGNRTLQSLFDGIVNAGVDLGVFKPANAKLASRAIMVCCRDVINWYRREGELSQDQVCNEFAEMALALLKADARG
jgi:AcrR family transcriptional regulator